MLIIILGSIEIQSLSTDYWPLFHLSADGGERSSSQFCSDLWTARRSPPPRCFAFSRRELPLQSATLQISHDVGLAMNPYDDPEFLHI